MPRQANSPRTAARIAHGPRPASLRPLARRGKMLASARAVA